MTIPMCMKEINRLQDIISKDEQYLEYLETEYAILTEGHIVVNNSKKLNKLKNDAYKVRKRIYSNSVKLKELQEIVTCSGINS